MIKKRLCCIIFAVSSTFLYGDSNTTKDQTANGLVEGEVKLFYYNIEEENFDHPLFTHIMLKSAYEKTKQNQDL